MKGVIIDALITWACVCTVPVGGGGLPAFGMGRSGQAEGAAWKAAGLAKVRRPQAQRVVRARQEGRTVVNEQIACGQIGSRIATDRDRAPAALVAAAGYRVELLVTEFAAGRVRGFLLLGHGGFLERVMGPMAAGPVADSGDNTVPRQSSI
jgi:hypothetical protein